MELLTTNIGGPTCTLTLATCSCYHPGTSITVWYAGPENRKLNKSTLSLLFPCGVEQGTDPAGNTLPPPAYNSDQAETWFLQQGEGGYSCLFQLYLH